MRRWVLSLAIALSACGQAIQADGSTQHPTVVSLNPCTDAILAQVTGLGQLLAISHYSHHPASSSMDIKTARRYPATGGTVEEIVALQPDMVVASSFMPPATHAALTDLGIRVETVKIASSIADSRAQIRDLATLTGHGPKGAALIGKIDAAIERAEPHGDQRIGAVLWQPAGIVPGDNALVSELMTIAGFTSHSAAMGLAQADYLSLEQLLANPPTVLLQAGQERGQHHPALADMARRGDIRTAQFDPSLLYCGGPTIIRALDRLRIIRDGQA